MPGGQPRLWCAAGQDRLLPLVRLRPQRSSCYGPVVSPGLSLSRAGARHGWRRVAVLLAGVVTVTIVGGYVALPLTANGLPRYPPAGWVAVLQPATAPSVDVVQLSVQARTEGDQTPAAYDVAVCGPRPYTGDLLLGGAARFTKILRNPFMPRSLPSPRVHPIHDLAFYFGGLIDLGAVQLVHISLPTVGACPPSSSLPPGTLPGGSDEGVSGITSGPVQQSWGGPWSLWHGPHASQAWPLTGAFPGVPAGALGEFTAVTGLSGNWIRPFQQYNKISADNVTGNWTVDSAVPSASGPYPLVWQSRTPLKPVVRLTDSPSLALLQDWIVIFAVGFGIAGSMLASMLFEWLRSGRQQSAVSSRNQCAAPTPAACQKPHSSPASLRTRRRWFALIGVAVVIGYARKRLFRTRSSANRSLTSG